MFRISLTYLGYRIELGNKRQIEHTCNPDRIPEPQKRQDSGWTEELPSYTGIYRRGIMAPEAP